MRYSPSLLCLLLPATAFAAPGGNSGSARSVLQGDVTLAGTDALTDAGGSLRINGGDLSLQGSAQLDFDASTLTVNGGSVVFAGSSSGDFGGSALIVNGGDLQFSDHAVISFNDSQLSVSGGNVTFGGSSRLVIESGAISISGGDFVMSDDAVLLLAGDATVTTSGNGSVSGTGLFTCEGRVCAGPTLDDDLALLEADGVTILIRIRQRPDLLAQEWDQLIDEAVSLLRRLPRTLEIGTKIEFPPISRTADLIVVPPGSDWETGIAAALELLDAGPCTSRQCDPTDVATPSTAATASTAATPAPAPASPAPSAG